MTAIERSAYPRFRSFLTHEELETYYTLTEPEIDFVQTKASGETQQLALALFLKAFQKLGYLPRLVNGDGLVVKEDFTVIFVPIFALLFQGCRIAHNSTG